MARFVSLTNWQGLSHWQIVISTDPLWNNKLPSHLNQLQKKITTRRHREDSDLSCHRLSHRSGKDSFFFFHSSFFFSQYECSICERYVRRRSYLTWKEEHTALVPAFQFFGRPLRSVCCTHLMHVRATHTWCMCVLHTPDACACYTHLIHVRATHTWCMCVLHTHLMHVRATHTPDACACRAPSGAGLNGAVCFGAFHLISSLRWSFGLHHKHVLVCLLCLHACVRACVCVFVCVCV